MSEFRVANRYAKSLIDLSREQNTLEQVYQDMQVFTASLKNNVSLQALLKSPIITSDKKFAVLKKVFENHFQKVTIAFFDIVLRKNRSMFLDAIADGFIAQYNALKNITTAEVKTAAPLDEKTHNEIKTFIAKATGKNVVLKTSVDSSLIGGLVIKMEDKLFDASIKGKLQKTKQELLNTYISK